MDVSAVEKKILCKMEHKNCISAQKSENTNLGQKGQFKTFVAKFFHLSPLGAGLA